MSEPYNPNMTDGGDASQRVDQGAGQEAEWRENAIRYSVEVLSDRYRLSKVIEVLDSESIPILIDFQRWLAEEETK